MSASEKTTNYGLPVYKEDDATTWADYNQSMQLIDAQMKRNADAAASGGDIPADVEQRLDALEDSSKQHTSEISSINTSINTMSSEFTEELETQGTHIGSLAQSQSETASDVEGLKSTTADHETRIHAVELSASENHTDILAAEQRIAVNENEIAIFNQEISDNQTNIAALQTDNTKNKQDIANLETWQSHALPGVEIYDFSSMELSPSFYRLDETGGATEFSISNYTIDKEKFYGMQYGENSAFRLGGKILLDITSVFSYACAGIRITISSMNIPITFYIRQPCIVEIATGTSKAYVMGNGYVEKNQGATYITLNTRFFIENSSIAFKKISIYF